MSAHLIALSAFQQRIIALGVLVYLASIHSLGVDIANRFALLQHSVLVMYVFLVHTLANLVQLLWIIAHLVSLDI